MGNSKMTKMHDMQTIKHKFLGSQLRLESRSISNQSSFSPCYRTLFPPAMYSSLFSFGYAPPLSWRSPFATTDPPNHLTQRITVPIEHHECVRQLIIYKTFHNHLPYHHLLWSRCPTMPCVGFRHLTIGDKSQHLPQASRTKVSECRSCAVLR